MKINTHTFSGDDPSVLRRFAVQHRLFKKMQLCIGLIALVCFIGSYQLFRHSLDSVAVGLLLALGFAWLLLNIYRLLLCIAGADTLPRVEAQHGRSTSTVLSFLFVLFLATTVSKPIEAMLYANVLEVDVADYRRQALVSSQSDILSYYKTTARMQTSTSRLADSQADPARKALQGAFNALVCSGFYIHRIRLLCTKYPSSWLITAGMVLLFLYPLRLKKLMCSGDYFEAKRLADRRLVDLNYYAFTRKYQRFFRNKYQQEVHLHAHWIDPPYNTRYRTNDKKALDVKDFLNEFYHA